MATELKPYSAYKDSGVPWLGEVPAHWEIRRLRSLASVKTGGKDTVNRQDGGKYPFFVRSQTVERINTWSFDGEAVLTAGDGVGVGRVFHYVNGRFDFHQRVYKFSDFVEVLGKYFFHYFSKTLSHEVLLGTAKSTVDSLRLPMLQNFPVSLPPLPEQTAIIRFLDHADRRIQRYIRAKQKLIALLEEQKLAVIHQAVTGQINVRTGQPYSAYKPSGVAWLGDVPAHWEVKKLHQCGTIAGGMTPSMENRRFWDGSIPWVTPKDMKRVAICDSDMKVAEAAIHETPLRLIDPPAVLMVVRGMILARKVPVAWTTSPVTINQDMKVLTPVSGINAEFLARMLDSAQDAFVSLIDEAGHGTRRLPTERWRSLAVAIAPGDEQGLIIDFLRKSVQSIIAAIDSARRLIVCLCEYRTRLIADVVTGKLDVREAAATLPEVDPLANEDPLDDTLDPGPESDIDELDATLEEAEA